MEPCNIDVTQLHFTSLELVGSQSVVNLIFGVNETITRVYDYKGIFCCQTFDGEFLLVDCNLRTLLQ